MPIGGRREVCVQNGVRVSCQVLPTVREGVDKRLAEESLIGG